MSKYTTEVRFICERAAGLNESVGYDGIENVLNDSWRKIFDFDFPIFDEAYRPVLCKKILKHYYTREIGFETVGLWKLKLNMLLNEIMPYYNKLYDSELLKFNPFYDADYTKDHEGSDDGEGSETGSHTGTVGDAGTHGGTVGDAGTHTGTIRDQGSKEGNIDDVGNVQLSETTWDVYSDTPQGALTNVENNTYLTNARKVSHDAETDTTNNRDYDEQVDNLRTFNEGQNNTRTYNETNGNTRTYNEATGVDREYSNTNQYVDHVVGKFPGRSYASMLKEFRETFLNIDVDVISDLSDLFIKLW